MPHLETDNACLVALFEIQHKAGLDKKLQSKTACIHCCTAFAMNFGRHYPSWLS
ncbi:MAG: hypothetical protein ACERJ2_19090 [Filomicrobium sp.]